MAFIQSGPKLETLSFENALTTEAKMRDGRDTFCGVRLHRSKSVAKQIKDGQALTIAT
jgi:hypothetical protein